MKKIQAKPFSTDFDEQLDAAEALLGVMLFEQATDINFYFGGAINKSNVELGITEKRKEQVAEELVEHLQNAGKNVNIAFWAI